MSARLPSFSKRTPAEATVANDATCESSGRWLRPLGDNWPGILCRLLEVERTVVRVVIAEVRGSAPREPGACMLVSPKETIGTIGGGRLEWQAAQAARGLLQPETPNDSVRIRRLTLGPDLGQCCGGVVQVWLERFTRADRPLLRAATQSIADGTTPYIATELVGADVTRRLLLPGSVELHEIEAKARSSHTKPTATSLNTRLRFFSNTGQGATLLERLEVATTQLWLYGAGHVGQALVRVLADLPFDITWIDERPELLPAALPSNIRAVHAKSPLETLVTAPSRAHYLVMTHDHALDYALCHAILERNDFAWLGLIGSKSKGARFRSSLARDQISPASIARLVCPIGAEGITSKWPAAIAVGVAAQLLQGFGSTQDVHNRDAANSAAPAIEPTAPDDCSGDCQTCSTRSARPT
jgi:xanthine dehydrogenase accessory factor